MLVITVSELNTSRCEQFFEGQPGEKIIRSLSELFFSNTFHDTVSNAYGKYEIGLSDFGGKAQFSVRARWNGE